MPTQHCQCGAKYRFPDSSVGKRAKCKKCGAVLTLAAEEENSPILLADDDFIDEADAAAKGDRAVTEAAPPVSAVYLPSSETVGRLGHLVVEEADKSKSYAQNIYASFFFLTSVHNALTFIVLWFVFFVLTLLLAGGRLGFGVFALLRFVCYLAFLGWWAAFRFNVVAAGAAGDNDLPNPAASGEGFGAFLMTFLQWVGSWVVVLVPAAVFAMVAFTQGWMDPNIFIDALGEGIAGLIFSDSGKGAGVFGGLVVLGMFFWPIIILCVALDGFGCISRVDLIVTTIVKTFPVYLFTAVMVFGTDWMKYRLTGFVGAGLSAGEDPTMSSWLGLSLVVSFLVVGITIYFEIVAMKLIGLYYHHFKDRFAWSWG